MEKQEVVKGRGWGELLPGERIVLSDFKKLKTGTLILSETRKFGNPARNVLEVEQSEFPFDPENGNKLYYKYHGSDRSPIMVLWKDELGSNIEKFYFIKP